MNTCSEETTRAIGSIFIRNQIRKRGEAAEQQFLAGFSPDEIHYYQTAIASSWVPMEFMNKVYCGAAGVLFPDDPLGLQKLGESMACDHLNGIYKIFFSMTSLAFIVKQTPKLWKCYHRKGRVRVEWKETDHFGRFVLEDYPELPESFRDLLNGYIVGLLKLTGRKDIRVVRNDEAACHWKWVATWHE